MILKSFKYRMYPNKSQKILLEKHFGCSRYIYNWGLDKKIKEYEQTGKSLSYVQLANNIPELKRENEWLKEVNAQSLQSSLKHLDMAFTRFFKQKKGFPKFKSKKLNYNSFSCPQHIKIIDNYLFFPKFNKGIKIKKHREFKGVIKNITISMTPTSKYHVSVLVSTEDKIKKPKKLQEKTTVGIDLGLKDFAVLSNGEKIANPKHLNKTERRLKIRQRRLSRKDKGSNNRKKYRIKLAKTHEKVSSQRVDFLHKLSSKIVRDNQSICIEDLNINGMIKNQHLSKAIGSVGWGEFIRQLNYKANWYGVNLIKIGRFEPSSQICSRCGFQNKELTLKDREWKCPICNLNHDRDVNASINIKKFGIITYGRNYRNLRLSDMNDISRSGQEIRSIKEE
jgi:putative transposase